MSEDFSGPKKPAAVWEPGTLDNTRKNIGPIDQEEAQKMIKTLGGQILEEKSAPIDYSAFPKKEVHYTHRASGKSSSDVSSSLSDSRSSGSSKKEQKIIGYASGSKKSHLSSEGLPEISSKDRNQMDKLMMSDDYKIKPNYGFFNFFRLFKKDGKEICRKSFIEYDIKMHLEHLQNFITTVKSLIQISPDTYKSKILNGTEVKFKFLRTTGGWTMRSIKLLAMDVQDSTDPVKVADLIPLTKALYKELIKVYYIGETQISQIFKDIYSDLVKYPKSDKDKLLMLSKTGLTEWLYVYSSIIRGMYPLLMRMCSPTFEYFPQFFTTQTPAILSFLGLTKFDIIIPEKKNEKIKQEEAKKAEEEKKVEEEKKKKAQVIRGQKTEIVTAGLKLLEQLFPEAGFSHLETMPDMYPYFQPLYQFYDGYNMLSPENPLQVTVTLLKITEDIFQGCRNIVFTEENDGTAEHAKDSLSSALNEWSLYREVLFEKDYGDQLRNFVNQLYSTSDFKTSIIGKKNLTSMLWQTRYNFLPNFDFEQILLEKPNNDSKYRPLCMRTDFLRQVFTSLSHNIDSAAKSKGKVLGIANPWDKYVFDIPNVVSKRMDVLLGAKKPLGETAATNANLIKYALCIVAVLDWWVNNPESPAYSTDSSKIYRINEKDGGPSFSVPVRNDQNKLFADSIKKSAGSAKA